MNMSLSSLPHKVIGVAVIWNEQGKILIDKRRPLGLHGGFWEFPGGKIEPGETMEACIEREIMEELGIVIAVGARLMTIEHDYTNFTVTLCVHNCRYLSGEPQTLECDEIRWVTLEEIDQFTFPKVNEQIIAVLRKNYGVN
ncbi:MAG: 8-oxo-dGTP diphosphatase MutT [Oscillatoriales cyanobacterium]|uniref:8-oxo-dGTP diphosphatase n=2 Tax=Microcoleus TaxID=44471 RepID=A0ABU8YNG4_9CYAN|nr:MAG: 8-oxo-dGTP diphosphatase MutT [Oscillatoriales cyanobacterium]TAD93628.1 MAG: 8-oxo-dGTP diphosphatase MutT [Oscillatoriales cyanobacterium]TAE00930.1 MAG: 8-oxo-dGTP diphosphatase MutT [Oscillatoriales cyanobacterium]TAF01543.1 MAG: 8-oxo-dGTP diphosphatase MutT [Oscillatoriales cyanobacterium]TAF35999.1 MAG: 8-oxo-dGTP diphosphatase MutT [Oscillatoriales cyanobacterium]